MFLTLTYFIFYFFLCLFHKASARKLKQVLEMMTDENSRDSPVDLSRKSAEKKVNICLLITFISIERAIAFPKHSISYFLPIDGVTSRVCRAFNTSSASTTKTEANGRRKDGWRYTTKIRTTTE